MTVLERLKERVSGERRVESHVWAPTPHLAALIAAAECLDHLRSYGCPVCHGDCASANPPVTCCPMQQAESALAPLLKEET